jgi:hydroxymethylpyrimidine pyrophosphatase-like HAD family hydrolase
MDGTLLDPAGKISPRVREAIGKAGAAGMTVVVATGRRYRTSRAIAEDAGLSSYVICQHGTHIRRMSDDSLVRSATFEEDAARAVVEVMVGHGFEPRVFLDGFDREMDFLIITPGAEPKEMFGYTGTAWRVAKEIEVPDGMAVMVVASFGGVDALEPALDEIRALGGDRVGVHVINPPGAPYWCLEAMSPRAGKGNALLVLAERLKVKPEETAAVGDDVNDIDMIEKAGVGIAMGNAVEAVKEAADFIVGANGDDGLAEAIERLLSNAT